MSQWDGGVSPRDQRRGAAGVPLRKRNDAGGEPARLPPRHTGEPARAPRSYDSHKVATARQHGARSHRRAKSLSAARPASRRLEPRHHAHIARRRFEKTLRGGRRRLAATRRSLLDAFAEAPPSSPQRRFRQFQNRTWFDFEIGGTDVAAM